MIRIVLWCVATLGFYAFFYRKVVKRWGGVVQPIVDRLGLQDTHPARDVEAVGKLAAASVAQALFAVLMMLAFGMRLDSVFGQIVRFDLVLLGVVLGLGELLLSSLICTAVVLLWQSRDPTASPGRVTEWLAQGRGGWMGQFGATVRTAPPWFAAIIVCGYVSIEELVFRGASISILREAGMEVAVLVTLTLFVLVQAFNMPTARGAVFPMVGALVVGLSHGIIYWKVPTLIPLIVAHLTFFAGALSISAPGKSLPASY